MGQKTFLGQKKFLGQKIFLALKSFLGREIVCDNKLFGSKKELVDFLLFTVP